MERDHSDWKHVLFYLGLSLLACHELDAMARHEWRLLPLLELLPDETGQTVFVVGHIPLFFVIFWLTGHRSPSLRRASQIVVDAILIAHAVGHTWKSDHELYEFAGPLSGFLIYGGAVVGLSHWLASARSRHL